jgi:hypothetical protein
MDIFHFEPNLQLVSIMAVILVLMPVLVLYCSSDKFITKWWTNKGRLIMLICYLLTALGYLISMYWGMIMSAL